MLTVEKKRIAAYVIKLVASVVNGVAPPENDNADWQGIIDFAKKQSVLNLVAYAAESLKIKPDEHTARFLDEFRMQKMIVEAQQELAAGDACKKLDEMGVRHMLLKG